MSGFAKAFCTGAATVCAASFAILAGCASAPKPVGASVFFPPAPELPRIQYLTSFTGRNDIEEQSGFDRFVVGEQKDLKVDKPYGIAVRNGKIYVCDTNSTVFVLDLQARSFSILKGAVGPGSLRQPVNVTIDQDGVKYVSDPGRGQVVVFDANDEYVKAYGWEKPWRPVDAAPFQDELFVVDAGNKIVRVFDRRSGETVRTIGDKGDPADRLDRPTNISMDAEGFLYVTDVGRFQVLKFDRDGHFRSTFGRLGDNMGHFARPKGTAIDRDGRLLAVDAAFNNVQIFNREGRLLGAFGGPGEMRGNLLLPAKVAVDYDNLEYFSRYVDPRFQASHLIFVTSQFGQRRVNVFAAGQEKGRKYPTDAELLKEIEEKRKKELEKAVPTPEKPAEEPPVPASPAAPTGG